VLHGLISVCDESDARTVPEKSIEWLHCTAGPTKAEIDDELLVDETLRIYQALRMFKAETNWHFYCVTHACGRVCIVLIELSDQGLQRLRHARAHSHARTHARTHIWTSMHTRKYAHTHTRIHAHLRARARTSTNTHTRTQAHTRTHSVPTQLKKDVTQWVRFQHSEERGENQVAPGICEKQRKSRR
jgi:hypothetical protein